MRARVERRAVDVREPARHARLTPQHARATHERGTRRARACIAWTTVGLMILCAAPRAWYASYIDVFGERGGQSIGDRIEARIRARETARAAARAAAVDARWRRGFGRFGGARASDDGGTGSGDGDGDGDDAMSTVATREVKAVDARGGGAGDARGPLDDRGTRLLESLQERLRKVNDERDSIIYLVRKIQGKALDGGDQAKTELTEEEIEELTERLALASESKSLLKKIGLGR